MHGRLAALEFGGGYKDVPGYFSCKSMSIVIVGGTLRRSISYYVVIDNEDGKLLRGSCCPHCKDKDAMDEQPL